MKKPTIFFFTVSNFHFIFTCLQNFTIRKFKKTKCRLFLYVNKILFIPATLNNIFDKNYKKFYNFANGFLKFVSIFTLSCGFIISTLLQSKWQPFQNGLTTSHFFQRTFFWVSVCNMFFHLAFFVLFCKYLQFLLSTITHK